MNGKTPNLPELVPLLVEVQRLFELVEEAVVINHDTELLEIVVGPIHACNRLEQGVVTDALVQVDGLQYGCVETGQEHVANDQNLHVAPFVIRLGNLRLVFEAFSFLNSSTAFLRFASPR